MISGFEEIVVQPLDARFMNNRGIRVWLAGGWFGRIFST
jgi:hypothetical protein